MFDSFTCFSVGSKAPAPFWDESKRCAEGASLEIVTGEQSSFCYLPIYMPRILGEEAMQLRKAPIDFRYVQEGPHLLSLISFRGIGFILELPYDPLLYPKEERGLRIKALENGMGVRMILIDSLNGVIRGLRTFPLPEPYRARLRDLEIQAPKVDDFSNKQLAWEMGLQNLWSTDELWEKAQKAA